MCDGKFYRKLPYMYAALNILEILGTVTIITILLGVFNTVTNNNSTVTTTTPTPLLSASQKKAYIALAMIIGGLFTPIFAGFVFCSCICCYCLCRKEERCSRPFLRFISLNCNCPCYLPRPRLRFTMRIGFHIFCIILRVTAIILFGELVNEAQSSTNKMTLYIFVIVFSVTLIFPLLTILLDVYHYRVWWAYEPDVEVEPSYTRGPLSSKHRRFIPYVLIESFRTATLGNRKCKNGDNCRERQLEHMVIFHSADFLPQPRWSPDYETYIGFHRTQAHFAISIAHSDIRISQTPPQMLGFGIYFARSISNTEGKARQRGAYICAEIRMGKVLTLTKSQLGRVKNTDSWWNEYDTVYYQHENEERDEFCVKSPDQVLKWIIYVEPPMDRKLAKYGMDVEFNDTVCYCV